MALEKQKVQLLKFREPKSSHKTYPSQLGVERQLRSQIFMNINIRCFNLFGNVKTDGQDRAGQDGQTDRRRERLDRARQDRAGQGMAGRTDRLTDRQTQRQRDRKEGRQTDRETDRQTERRTDRQTDRLK